MPNLARLLLVAGSIFALLGASARAQGAIASASADRCIYAGEEYGEGAVTRFSNGADYICRAGLWAQVKALSVVIDKAIIGCHSGTTPVVIAARHDCSNNKEVVDCYMTGSRDWADRDDPGFWDRICKTEAIRMQIDYHCSKNDAPIPGSAQVIVVSDGQNRRVYATCTQYR